jgi:hypothetical protein
MATLFLRPMKTGHGLVPPQSISVSEVASADLSAGLSVCHLKKRSLSVKSVRGFRARIVSAEMWSLRLVPRGLLGCRLIAGPWIEAIAKAKATWVEGADNPRRVTSGMSTDVFFGDEMGSLGLYPRRVEVAYA